MNSRALTALGAWRSPRIVLMTKNLLLGILLGAAPLIYASTLNPLDCVGANVPACPGFIENFTGSPGTFVNGLTQTGTYGFVFDVTLTTAVFRNPNGVTLDFYYQFRNASAATLGMPSAQISSFGTFNVNGGIRKDAFGSFGSGPNAVTFDVGTADPTTLSRDKNLLDGSGPDFFLSFSEFLVNNDIPALEPGQTSPTLILKTDATEYTAGFVAAFSPNPNANASFRTFQPASPAPEPSTALYAISPLVFFWLLARSRRHSQQPSFA